MTSILAEAALTIGSSLAASIVAKATAIAAAALVAARLARRSRSSVRHLIFAAASVILLVLPILTLTMPAIEVPFNTRTMAAPTVSPMHEGPFAPATALKTAGMPAAPTLNGEAPISIPTLLGMLWVGATAIFLLPVAAGLWQLRRVRRFALPWLHGDRLVRELASDAGIRRQVRVLLHESVAGPMTCGLIHPKIMFPPDVQTWNDGDVRRAIIHELEHVRRGDWLTHCLARVVCALYWFHPLVWIAWRQLSLEAERACDDAVVRRGEPIGYAEQLVTLAQRLSNHSNRPFLAMASRGELPARVAALLDTRQRRGRIGTLCVVAALTFAVMLAVAISPVRAVAVAQSPGAANEDRPAFEVASIKPSNTGGPFGVEFLHGRFTAHTNLFVLIGSAYRIPWKQLAGDSPILTERFDIEARAAANAIPEDAPVKERGRQLQLMLQTLLADRFQLAIHKETKELPIYALVIGKNGPRLKPSNRNCAEGATCGRQGGGPAGGLSLLDAEVSMLAEALSAFMDRPVVDRTRLQGRFDIQLSSWNPSAQMGTRVMLDNQEPEPSPTDASIFTVLQEQLGLRLESTRGPLDLYVVDHVERPTPD